MCFASFVCTVEALVSLAVPGMGKKGNFRNLKDPNDATQHLQPTQPFKTEMEEASTACCLCATRSPCVHFRRVASIAGVGIGDFTDKTSKEKGASQYSSDDDVLFSPSLSSGCDCRQHTGSEAQPARDTLKGLTDFDNQKISNQFVKHKELESLGDNISCVKGSYGTNVATGNHIGGPDRKNASCSLASDDSFTMDEKVVNDGLGYLFLATTHFETADRNHCDVQNFTEEPPLAEGEPFECSIKQVEPSLARKSVSELGHWIYGIYRISTFGGADAHLNCFEIEGHPYHKNLIKSTAMQESRQSQPGNPSNVSDLMDDWVKVCDTCGDVGADYLLVSCNKCPDGAQHTYCMRVKLFEVPKDWTCEECMPRGRSDKLMQDKVEGAARRKKGRLSESSTNIESSKGLKLKFRSSYAGKSRTNGASSVAHLLAKRRGVPLEAQQVKKVRPFETSSVSPRSFKPCNNSLLRKDLSCKKFKRVKTKSVNDIVYSCPQMSCDSQEKEKVPHACGGRERVSTLAELGKKGGARETSVVSPKASNSGNHCTLGREPPSKKLGKVKLKAAGSVTSLKQSSYGAKKKAKLPYCLGDGSPKLDSQTKIAHAKCSLLKSSSSKAANLKPKGQLAKAGCLQKQKVGRNPAFHDDRKGKEKSEKETISSSDTLFSGSSFRNLDAVESSRKSDHRLQASNHNTHKDSDCPNEKKKNESQQAEHPKKAATAMMKGPSSDERSHLRHLAQVEVAALSKGLVIPRPHYAWLGKFQIHSSEGIARTCDGIQAHLSTHASPKVLEVMDRLPEIIILEELPRLRIWPSQFMGGQVTEENIALYFFAKDVDSYYTYYRGLMNYMTKNDLALKGNLDGVELLIFPSNILPEETQWWNQMLFFWGIFKGRKVNNSANTPVSNSLKPENRNAVKIRPFDLNAYPVDEDDEAGVDEIPEFDSKGGATRPSGDRILVVGDSSNGKGGEAKPKCAVVDVNLSLQARSSTPENGSVGIEGTVGEPSKSLSLAPPLTAIHAEYLDPVDCHVAITLMLLSRDRF